MKFTAHVQHSEETFQQLAQAQYNAYCQGSKLFMMGVSVFFLFLGVMLGGGAPSLLCLFIGCWMMTFIQMPARRNADKMIKLAAGDFPASSYVFLEDAVQITSSDTVNTVAYNTLFGFLEDPKYFYLFINSMAGYIVPKASLRPADIHAFREFITGVSGLKAAPVSKAVSFNIRTLLARRKK